MTRSDLKRLVREARKTNGGHSARHVIGDWLEGLGADRGRAYGIRRRARTTRKALASFKYLRWTLGPEVSATIADVGIAREISVTMSYGFAPAWHGVVSGVVTGGEE